MDDYMDEEILTDVDPDTPQRNAPLYKKFFRTRAGGGLLSVQTWLEKGKLNIDVGELTADGKLASNTMVWCDAIKLLTYLRAVREGYAGRLYPAVENQLPSDESIAFFGGGNTKDGPVARVLKIHHWENYNPQTKVSTFDTTAFVVKTGHFPARVTGTGAYIQNGAAISQNRIKMTRVELAELATRLEMALFAHAARTEKWVDEFAAKRD